MHLKKGMKAYPIPASLICSPKYDSEGGILAFRGKGEMDRRKWQKKKWWGKGMGSLCRVCEKKCHPIVFKEIALSMPFGESFVSHRPSTYRCLAWIVGYIVTFLDDSIM